MNPHVRTLTKAVGLYVMLNLLPSPGFGQLLASVRQIPTESRQGQPVKLRDALLKLKGKLWGRYSV